MPTKRIDDMTANEIALSVLEFASRRIKRATKRSNWRFW